MKRIDFLARYCDVLGKRFTVADETQITREELKLIWQDLATLQADAMTSAPCDHSGGRYLQQGFRRCAICMQPVEV